ncbi:hypothetical protein [Flavobacterium faecale]|uniref:hypothetical protein n=1 Tax=Flavobacterium faecale TaxID=1355330 RepID=UPI003AACF5B1
MKNPFIKRKIKDELSDDNNDLKNGLIIFLSIIIFWFFCGIGFNLIRKEWVKSIAKDDVFEAINSLFSGLAFAGLIYTIILQRKELSLQRKELKDTRDVFQEQSSLMKFQQKVNVFFQMIENHRGVVKSLNTTIKTYKNNPELTRSEEIETKREGYEVIEDKINQINNILLTSSSIHISKSGNFNYFSQKHPSILKHKYKDLDNIYTSLKMIIEFIITQLENDTTYHKIFYNAISKNEKIIIGIYSNFFEEKENQIVSKTNFSYLEEYNQAGYKTIIGLKLPYLNLNLEPLKLEINFDITSINLPKLVLTNPSQYQIKLKEIIVNKIEKTKPPFPQDDYSKQEEFLRLPFNLIIDSKVKTNIALDELLLSYIFNEEYSKLTNKVELTKEDLKLLSAYFIEKKTLKLILNIEYKEEIYNIDLIFRCHLSSYANKYQIIFSIQ